MITKMVAQEYPENERQQVYILYVVTAFQFVEKFHCTAGELNAKQNKTKTVSKILDVPNNFMKNCW